MNKTTSPSNDGLEPFIEKLEKSHYDIIISLCETAKKQAQKLRDLEVQKTTSQYVILCNKLIEEIQQYIGVKKEHLLPYLKTLSEKSNIGHDCQSCTGTGSCGLQHDMQLSELKDSHNQLNDIIYRLQMVALPLYSESIYPDVYRILRNQMALLENSLAELFFQEENYLIPKVTEAQKKIHVRD